MGRITTVIIVVQEIIKIMTDHITGTQTLVTIMGIGNLVIIKLLGAVLSANLRLHIKDRKETVNKLEMRTKQGNLMESLDKFN